EEHLGEIFRAGFRGVNDANIAGMGFRLATCARIIDAQQGRIWIEAIRRARIDVLLFASQ
ncbi:MAG: hypothetical protein ACR2NZ_13380, partial [Rubripirellula sp.]